MILIHSSFGMAEKHFCGVPESSTECKEITVFMLRQRPVCIVLKRLQQKLAW